MQPKSISPYQRAHINSALISPEILYDIARVEQGLPAGPGFVHSLSSLIEASVLHEAVYVVPQQQYIGSGWRGYGEIGQTVAGSTFLKGLLDEQVLVNLVPDRDMDGVPPPSVSQLVDQIIQQAGLVEDYDYIDFMTETQVAHVMFASNMPELDYLEQEIDLLSIPGVYTILEAPFDHPLKPPTAGEIKALKLALKRGFTMEDMQIVSGFNRRARAIEDLASAMNMALYTNFVSLPHFIATLDAKVKMSRELLNKMNAELAQDGDEPLERPGLRSIPTAPLVRLVLQEARGDPRGVPEVILSLRKRHSHFRDALTEYEEKWFSAKTYRERRMIRKEFDRAWQTLIDHEERPDINWLYTIYDILKKPLEAHVTIGDLAKNASIERSLINRVKGLRSFWNELEKAPLSKEVQGLLQKTYDFDRDAALWRSYDQISRKLNQRLDPVRADV